jgi:hypothetical protein
MEYLAQLTVRVRSVLFKRDFFCIIYPGTRRARLMIQIIVGFL